MNKVYSLDVPPAYPRAPSPNPMPASENEGLAVVQGLLRAIRRRLSLLVAVFLLTFAGVAVFTFQLKPRYTATSSVIVSQPKQKVVDIGAVLQGLPADAATVDTEVEILKSRSLISRVVDGLDLLHNPEFNWAVRPPTPMQKNVAAAKAFIKSLAPGKHAAAPPPAQPADPAAAQQSERDGVIDAVLGAIAINRHGTTFIIEISATAAEPEMASKLANAVADAYVDNQLNTKVEATKRASSLLSQRVNEMRDEVKDAESKVESRRAQTGLLSAEGSTLTEQAIRDLNNQLSTARADYAEKKARLDSLNAQLKAGATADTIAEAQKSQTIISLRQQLAALAPKKADLETRYGEKYPEVQRVLSEERDLKRQLDAELVRITSSLEQDAYIANERVKALNNSLDQQKNVLTSANKNSVELNELERDADASKQLYESFLNRSKEINQLDGMMESDAVINSRAPVPGFPSYPRTSLNLALGMALGMALAGLVGLIAELLDNYLSSPEEVEQTTGAPYIGQIPLLPSTGNFTKAKLKPAEYLIEKPHSGYAEAFRNLRASIMFADIDKAAKTVAVVSSLPDEGKTSMTYCLGRMAAMSGTKTIVIDGDVRRRQLTEISGVAAEVGLLEYLFGETRLADAIATDEKTGLHILPLTDRKHTPRDVFGSRAFDALLNMLQQTYDLIIIDTGPILLLAETRVITRKVDQVVVAARWRKTNRRVLRETIKVLRDFNANIAGVVLTFVDLRKRSQHAYSSANYRAYSKYYRND